MLHKNIKQSNSLVRRHIMFRSALHNIDAISVSKGQQSCYVGSLMDLLLPSANDTQTPLLISFLKKNIINLS